jgi:hypothetical protein
MDHIGRSVCSNLAFPATLHSRRRFGIVDILVARKTAKHGLPQHSDESMAAVNLRSKSSLTTSPLDSPVGFAMIASSNPT